MEPWKNALKSKLFQRALNPNPYTISGTEVTSGTGYVYGTSGNQTINGRFEGDFGIEDLSWETVKKTDIGIEIGLWDCINIQADYFHEKREDIFMQRKTIPETAGFNKNPWANFGIVKNQGFDASLEMNKSFNHYNRSFPQ